MKIVDTKDAVELWLHSPIDEILSILIRGADGSFVWDVLHESFKPAMNINGSPVVVGKDFYPVGPPTVTVTPFDELRPDAEDIALEQYKSRIVVGDVPVGYQQRVPNIGEKPRMNPKNTYYIRIWTRDNIERAVFTKK